jgi:hypothetical protein
MLPSLQLEALPALVPLKVTVLLPWLVPKLLPVMVTAVPISPEVGDRLEMLAAGTMVYTAVLTGLLAIPVA